jgi:hypothetical protein
MDRYTVIITGSGPHHSGAPNDIDAILGRCLADLRASGHADVRVTLTANGRDENVEPAATIATPPARLSDPSVTLALRSLIPKSE